MKQLRVREFPEYLGWQVACVVCLHCGRIPPFCCVSLAGRAAFQRCAAGSRTPTSFPLFACLPLPAFPSPLCCVLTCIWTHAVQATCNQEWFCSCGCRDLWRGHWAWGPAPDVTCFDPWCWGHGVGGALLCQTKILGCPALSAANVVPTQITLRGAAPQIAGAPPTPLRPSTHPKNSL